MIDPNLDFLPPKETWRWGFIINTNEKNYRFMFNDKNLFDGFLFAFSCIYRSDTNKPLYEIHIPELIYGDLPHDQHQMPLKTQPDLPNIIQTEIQDPLSMNASPNNQMASQLGTQGINMYRQEPSNDKEEERINHNSPELNQNANHTNQDTNQQKDETVNPPQKQFARRNSFFDNNAPNPSTSTVTMNSNPTTVINKDPEIPKPPKKTKSKPVEQPPEENKKTFVSTNYVLMS